MTIRLANYRKAGRNTNPTMVLIATGEDRIKVEEVFGDQRVRCMVSDNAIRLEPDKSSHYRWGKYEQKQDRRKLSVIHSNKLPTFGSTDVTEFHWTGQSLLLTIPENLSEPIKRTKPIKKKPGPTTDLTLRQAVEAVNAHKARLGQDLCLSIDAKGELRALIEY